MLAQLKRSVEESLRQVAREHADVPEHIAFDVDYPPETQFGDWSINCPMKLARFWRRPPVVIAQQLSDAVQKKISADPAAGLIDRFEIRPPGYINIFLHARAWPEVVKEVLARGTDYGRGLEQRRERILIEYVSANPTGPLSIAHARQAAVGESLTNILAFSGRQVWREYYINDEGNQIANLGLSLRARYLEQLGRDPGEFPADGYRGEYVRALADTLIQQRGAALASGADEAAERQYFSTFANDAILAIIKQELADFGVGFDSWFSQKALSGRDDIPRVLDLLRQREHVFEQDGATWLRSTSFGDDKDRVLIKGDGSYTYLTPDIAYHADKFRRGFDRIVNIWGPDHHGYINRLKAAVEALGYDPRRVVILIIQLATLFRGGKPAVMSTRAGEYVSLRELMQEVGKDAARFFLVMRKCDSQLEFDLELAKQHSLDNPVYYIQYAHARVAGIRALKQERWGADPGMGDLSCLNSGEEISLMRALSRFPGIIEDCSRHLEPVGLTLYLRELAGLFHAFYNKHRVITDDSGMSLARSALAEALQQVIATGLGLLGVNAPEKM